MIPVFTFMKLPITNISYTKLPAGSSYPSKMVMRHLLSVDVAEKSLKELGVLGQMQSQNWTIYQSSNQLENGLGNFRTCCVFENMSEC